MIEIIIGNGQVLKPILSVDCPTCIIVACTATGFPQTLPVNGFERAPQVSPQGIADKVFLAPRAQSVFGVLGLATGLGFRVLQIELRFEQLDPLAIGSSN